MNRTKALDARIQAVSPVSKLAPSWPNAIEGSDINDSKAIARGFFLMYMEVVGAFCWEVEIGMAEDAVVILLAAKAEINGKSSKSVA